MLLHWGQPEEVPMDRVFTVIVERDADGNFVASVPAIPGCHTQASTREELIERVREAIEACLDDAAEAPLNLEFVGVEEVTVAV